MCSHIAEKEIIINRNNFLKRMDELAFAVLDWAYEMKENNISLEDAKKRLKYVLL